jgi:hypothetical protein
MEKAGKMQPAPDGIIKLVDKCENVDQLNVHFRLVIQSAFPFSHSVSVVRLDKTKIVKNGVRTI